MQIAIQTGCGSGPLLLLLLMMMMEKHGVYNSSQRDLHGAGTCSLLLIVNPRFRAVASVPAATVVVALAPHPWVSANLSNLLLHIIINPYPADVEEEGDVCWHKNKFTQVLLNESFAN